MKTQLFLLFSILSTLVGSIGLITNSTFLPMRQESLHQPSIYAYRDWQSVGILVNPGDHLRIRAQGSWFYTPREYHGADGHPRYPAPDYYPVPYAAGGVLIGKIGDGGAPFVIGELYNSPIYESGYSADFRGDGGAGGLLYLRINDDILSDNEGSVQVDVQVERAEAETR